jgi:hypothetical protein
MAPATERFQEIPADRGPAADGVITTNELGVIGEQRRHFVPQTELRVLRVMFLQALDLPHRFCPLDLLGEPVDARNGAGWTGLGAGRRGHADAECSDGEGDTGPKT